MMKINTVAAVTASAAGALFAGGGVAVLADVAPPMVQETLAPGESIDVEKTVTLPTFPPKLDVCLVVDISGSYVDDLPNLQSLAPGIFDAVQAEVADVRFGLASFSDFPFDPWGSAGFGDAAYFLNQVLTSTKDDWVAAVNALGIRFGADEPESQYEATFQAATGAGRDVQPPGPSDGDIQPGLQCGDWREDATRLIMLTTDASFHNAGDSGPFPYPGPSQADVVNALNALGIKFIGLKAPGSTTQMDDLATATGGTTVPTTSTSSDIADAILDALEALTFEVTGEASACEPLDVTFDPASHSGVGGGETVEFVETIAVPADVTGDELDDDGQVHCKVEFFADDTLLGIQTVWITVERTVSIDIKPGSFPNSINIQASGEKGVIPVAILGSAEFDVTQVDVSTVRFGQNGTEAASAHDPAGHLEDVNLDGFTDLVFHFLREESGILPGDTEATLTGQTLDGINFTGTDSVRTVPPGGPKPQ